MKLSGGQRQRLAIARILLYDPDVIVFDEASSALDGENEKGVMEALHGIARHKTIIVIAHRFRTIEQADQVIVLRQGRVEAQGRVDELLNCSQEFRTLFPAQAAAREA